MVQMTVNVPDELAGELSQHQEHLLLFLQLGLAEWHKQKDEPYNLQVEQTLDQLADEGKLFRPKVSKRRKQRNSRTLMTVSGRPASELVVDLRNRP